jgi:hypothetical protein
MQPTVLSRKWLPFYKQCSYFTIYLLFILLLICALFLTSYCIVSCVVLVHFLDPTCHKGLADEAMIKLDYSLSVNSLENSWLHG